jgi:hypothetical protein
VSGVAKAVLNTQNLKQAKDDLARDLIIFEGTYNSFASALRETKKWETENKVKICSLSWGLSIKKGTKEYLDENFVLAKALPSTTTTTTTTTTSTTTTTTAKTKSSLSAAPAKIQKTLTTWTVDSIQEARKELNNFRNQMLAALQFIISEKKNLTEKLQKIENEKNPKTVEELRSQLQKQTCTSFLSDEMEAEMETTPRFRSRSRLTKTKKSKKKSISKT